MSRLKHIRRDGFSQLLFPLAYLHLPHADVIRTLTALFSFFKNLTLALDTICRFRKTKNTITTASSLLLSVINDKTYFCYASASAASAAALFGVKVRFSWNLLGGEGRGGTGAVIFRNLEEINLLWFNFSCHQFIKAPVGASVLGSDGAFVSPCVSNNIIFIITVCVQVSFLVLRIACIN